MKLFLVGFMGAGKTTIGKSLAKSLKFEFRDTDALIEEEAGKSIVDIFDIWGEEKFRSLENDILGKIDRMDGNYVIATGGGMPCHNNNMTRLNQMGLTFYLLVGVETLAKRLKKGGDDRPLLLAKKATELKKYIGVKLQSRRPVYKQAKYTILANGEVASIVKRIQSNMKKEQRY